MTKSWFYPVQWYEGMLLRPQHFQQDQRYHHHNLHYHLHWNNAYHWGVIHMQFDHSLLVSNGLVRVLKLEAILPNSVVIHPSETPLEIALESKVEELQKTNHRIYVCFAQDHDQTTSNKSQYYSIEPDPVCDLNTGDNPVPVVRLKPKIWLEADVLPPSHVVSMPIMEVSYDGKNYKKTDYIAPLLQVGMMTDLGKMCLDICAKIRAKISYLHTLQEGKDVHADPQLEMLYDIKCRLLKGLLPFESLLRSDHVSPFLLFLTLSSLTGDCASFHPATILPEFPAYDPNNLRVTYQRMIDFISQALESIEETHEIVFLDQKDRIFYLAPAPSWSQDASLTLILYPQGHMHRDDLRTWASQSVIASEDALPRVQENRILGANRVFESHQDLPTLPNDTLPVTVSLKDAYINPEKTLYIINTSDSAQQRPTRIGYFRRLTP